MVSSSEHRAAMQSRLGQALKTTARDALFLLYKNKFQKANPGKKPYDVLMVSAKAKEILQKNPPMAKVIKEDVAEKLDITALCLLLRYCCGLRKKPSAWKDLSLLEGNISELRILRNADGHWTEEGSSDSSVKESWDRMEAAVTKVLQLGDLKSHVPRFKKELHDKRVVNSFQRAYDSDEVRASMQDELREGFRNGNKTTQMPLVWAGKNFGFHHKATSTYTSCRFSVNREGTLVPVESDGVVGARGAWQTLVVQGESGTGKTSLLRYLAALWSTSPCPLSSLAAFEFLLFLDCNAVTTRTFKVFDILKEVFPKATSKWRPATLLKVLTQAGSSVMIMIDAFDERLEAFQDAFQNLQKACPEAFFLITTRPHCVPAIVRLCEKEVLRVTAHGFSRASARSYVGKLLALQGRSGDPDQLLHLLSHHEELLAIPQLLCWSTWFWTEEGGDQFSTLGKTFLNVTEFILKKMCHINGKRVLSGEVPKEGQKWLSLVARVAFDHTRSGRSSLAECSPEVKQLYSEASKLRLRPREAVSSLMQCDESRMTGVGEHITFHFLHTSHANFLVAYHICETLKGNKKATIIKLLKGFKDDKQAILSFVVSLLYVNDKGKIDLKREQEISTVAKDFVHFYDINYYLTLIEESGHSQSLAKALACNMPVDTSCGGALLTPPLLGMSGMTSSNVPPAPSGHLWLRRRELKHAQALSMLLSAAKPARLWLHLSPPDACVPDPSPADVVAAMRLISKAYEGKPLCDLRVSGLVTSTPVSWPRNLWWLTLERAKLKGSLGLRKGLLKLTYSECSGVEKVSVPTSVKSLTLQRMDVKDLCVGEGVECLTLESCNIQEWSVPAGLKKVNLIDCSTNDGAILSLSRQHRITANIETSFGHIR
ncbi:uncharacterized protein LOC119585779 [Penaeus monodon]|uniref:uncharacterized protein LOC119585779 n=1 Tax=Penaeus monodon TaxID=6687 RepID=UPI0018A6FAA0|nr:uncharacterized protein LOC119585779 [Penaeus monodon]